MVQDGGTYLTEMAKNLLILLGFLPGVQNPPSPPYLKKVRQISQYPNIVRVLAVDWYTWPLRWREAAERTIDALWNRLAELLNHFPPQECANYPGIPAAASRVGRD
jgi:hypothetical protein